MTRSPGLRVYVNCGASPAPGWINLDPLSAAADLICDVSQGLPPDLDAPIERIYAGSTLECLPRDALPWILAAWRGHPQVSSQTLLVVVGTNRSKLTDQRGSTTLTGAETYHLLRDAGWGVHSPYPREYLALDGWPVPDCASLSVQFAALCRAIK